MYAQHRTKPRSTSYKEAGIASIKQQRSVSEIALCDLSVPKADMGLLSTELQAESKDMKPLLEKFQQSLCRTEKAGEDSEHLVLERLFSAVVKSKYPCQDPSYDLTSRSVLYLRINLTLISSCLLYWF